MRKKYVTVVEARNLAIVLKNGKITLTEKELRAYRSIFKNAKRYIIRDARKLLKYMKKNDSFNKNELLEIERTIDRLARTLPKIEDIKSFEYLLAIDFELINKINSITDHSEKEHFVLIETKPETIKVQLENLVDGIRVLNKTMVLFLGEQLKLYQF